jgi:hypothetical protein
MSIKLPVIDFIVGGKVIAESQSPFDQTHLFTPNRTKIPPTQPKNFHNRRTRPDAGFFNSARLNYHLANKKGADVVQHR